MLIFITFLHFLLLLYTLANHNYSFGCLENFVGPEIIINGDNYELSLGWRRLYVVLSSALLAYQ